MKTLKALDCLNRLHGKLEGEEGTNFGRNKLCEVVARFNVILTQLEYNKRFGGGDCELVGGLELQKKDVVGELLVELTAFLATGRGGLDEYVAKRVEELIK